MINYQTAIACSDKSRVVLNSNIILYEPNEKVFEHVEIVEELIDFISTIYHRFYKNTLVINPNMGEIGFELLGLGVTNRITFCDDSSQRLSYYKQIANNHFIPYFVDTYNIKYPADIPNKPYDLIIITIPEALQDRDALLNDYLETIRPMIPLTADMLLIENDDSYEEKFKHIANVTGFYHETTRFMGKRAILHFKLQHDFMKTPNHFTKSLRGFFAKI